MLMRLYLNPIKFDRIPSTSIHLNVLYSLPSK
nr:MAG TPA: hypothetical protein [Caudoviricetes sp.]